MYGLHRALLKPDHIRSDRILSVGIRPESTPPTPITTYCQRRHNSFLRLPSNLAFNANLSDGHSKKTKHTSALWEEEIILIFLFGKSSTPIYTNTNNIRRKIIFFHGAVVLSIYRARQKNGYQVARIFQARPGSGKRQQEQNSRNLGTIFLPDPVS